MQTIDNWQIKNDRDGYRIVGTLTGDGPHQGAEITTAVVKGKRGSIITLTDGTKYRLGNIDTSWSTSLKEQGIKIVWKNKHPAG